MITRPWGPPLLLLWNRPPPPPGQVLGCGVALPWPASWEHSNTPPAAEPPRAVRTGAASSLRLFPISCQCLLLPGDSRKGRLETLSSSRAKGKETGVGRSDSSRNPAPVSKILIRREQKPHTLGFSLLTAAGDTQSPITPHNHVWRLIPALAQFKSYLEIL